MYIGCVGKGYLLKMYIQFITILTPPVNYISYISVIYIYVSVYLEKNIILSHLC